MDIAICRNCRHFRERTPVKPFRHNDYHTPEILEEVVKWEEEQNKKALLEQQRFDREEEFDYEPINYPWCARWTTKENRRAIDPISGEKRRIYILCARANANGDCTLFEE
ncbi:MAG: hypothetical protein MRJ96_06950 [Nitrospirales bacterium]|nr:hypothetical protein [Nitrospirales bacterium]